MKERATIIYMNKKVVGALICLFFLSGTYVEAQENMFHKTLNTPAAVSVAESKQLLNQRKNNALFSWSRQDVHEWTDWVEPDDPGGSAKVSFPNQANAKLNAGVDIDEVNKEIRSGNVYSEVGTHTNLPFGLMKKGDYDFTLLWLTNLAFNHFDSPALSEEAKSHLASVLLNQEGNKHLPRRWWFFIPETENHILMTESSRYLKNDLVSMYGLQYASRGFESKLYDNGANGFDEWMLEQLASFLEDDFDEYNSKPYEGYTTIALQNLFEFSNDERVRLAARSILDYQALKYAFQSLDMRRVVPFRRRPSRAEIDNVYERDPAAARYALLAGNYSASSKDDFAESIATHIWVVPALGTYRIPDVILDFMIEKEHHAYLMKAAHSNTEIVYGEEDFLISAGGHYHKRYPLPFTKVENGIVRPTVIMLKGESPLISEMIRFEGRTDTNKLNHTCVYNNFACGVNLVIPDSVIDVAMEVKREDGWIFIDTGNVFIASYRVSEERYLGVENGGLIEIIDQENVESFDTFMRNVLSENEKSTINLLGESTYVLSSGESITFEILPEKRKLYRKRIISDENTNKWKIKAVDGVSLNTDFSTWPLLEAIESGTGEILAHADGEGRLEIYNPHLNTRLSYDLSDFLRPVVSQ